LTPLQNFLEVTVLPSFLVLFVIVLVAALGQAQWRRTIVVLAIVALIQLIVGEVVLRLLLANRANPLSSGPGAALFESGTPMLLISSSLANIGMFLGLILAARNRAWGWFIVQVIAGLVSMVGSLFAFSAYSLTVFLGSARAYRLYERPAYILLTAALFSATLIAQLAFALLTRDPAERAAAIAIPDDVTHP
jgi:hypothetical protein